MLETVAFFFPPTLGIGTVPQRRASGAWTGPILPGEYWREQNPIRLQPTQHGSPSHDPRQPPF